MRDAVLLLGATGTGKTPLGEFLEARGLSRHRCVHFDFGACLRRAAAGPPTALLAPADIEHIRRVLAGNALLADDQFPIARAILRDFVEQRGLRPCDRLILNGLPRHEGQARNLEPDVRVRLVVHLDADEATVRERIRLDTGGDRAARADDSDAEIGRKLATFQRVTAPLIDYYKGRQIPIWRVGVTAGMKPDEMAAQIPEDAWLFE